MLSPDQSFAAYVSMDGQRSLTGLRQQLLDDGLVAPSLGALKKWSSRYEWVSRAQEHDQQVAARASEMSVEAEAQERASVATKLDQAASLGADIVIEALKGLQGQVTTIEDTNHVLGIVDRASAVAREIEAGKNPASAFSGVADELEKSDGPGQTFATQLRLITNENQQSVK